MRHGRLLLMMDGQPMMLVWCADNLVSPDSVSAEYIVTLSVSLLVV